MLAAFRQELIGDTWQAIDDVQWRYDEKAVASILTINGTRTVDWDDDGNGARSFALPGGGFSRLENALGRWIKTRRYHLYTKPDFSCYVATVRLPTSTQARQWSSKPSFDTRMFGRNYYRAFDNSMGWIFYDPTREKMSVGNG